MHTIAIVNEKGGTGKTTTAVNLSAALGELGHKILLVDLDGQAASSRWLGVEDDTTFAESLYAGRGLKPIPDVIRNVSLAPASGKLDAVAHDLRPTQGGQLRRLLNEVAEAFEYTIIDCPPSLGNRLIGNALLAASHAIVPVETSILAMDGLKILLTTLDDVREGFDHNIILAGVLACRYDARTRLSRLVLAELKRALPGKVFETVIRENVRMRECPASGQSILTYAPDCHAAEDYRAAAMELVTSPRLTSLPVAGDGAGLTAEMTAAEGDMKIGHVLRQSVRKSIRDGEGAEQPVDWKESLEDAKRRLEAEGVLTPEAQTENEVEPEAASDAKPQVVIEVESQAAIPPVPPAVEAGADKAEEAAVLPAEPVAANPSTAPNDAARADATPVAPSEPAPAQSAPPVVEPEAAVPSTVEQPSESRVTPASEPVVGAGEPSTHQAADWDPLYGAGTAADGRDAHAFPAGSLATLEPAVGQTAAGPAIEPLAAPVPEIAASHVSPTTAGPGEGVNGLSFRLDTTPVDRRAGADVAPPPSTVAATSSPQADQKSVEPPIPERLAPDLNIGGPVSLPQSWEQPAVEAQTADDGVKPDCPHLRQVIQKMQWKKPDAPREDKPVKKGLIARLLARNAGK